MEKLKQWLISTEYEKFITALIALSVVFILSKVAQSWISRHVKDTDIRYRVRKIVTFLSFFAAVIVSAAIFSVSLSGLSLSIGVAGAGVAFALQEVIASVAGWAAISFGSFYSPGDRIQIGGITGDVIDIGILRTTVMEVGQWVKADLYNGRIVRIANSAVFKGPVFNYSGDFPFLWDEITLPVRYGSDWEYTRTILGQVVDEICRDYAIQSAEAWEQAVYRYRLEPARIEPMVTLAATDNWIEFTVRYIVDYRNRRSVKDRLFTRFLEEVDRSKNRIRLASATVELSNLPRLDVRFLNGEGSIDPHYVP